MPDKGNHPKKWFTTANIVTVISICMAVFQLYSSVRTVDTYILRSTHLAFALVLAFLIWQPNGKKRGNNATGIIDIILVVAVVFCAAYPIINFERLVTRWPYVSPITTGDFIYGTMLILLVIEASRRTLGWILPGIAIVSIVYVYYGKLLPSMFQHRGFTVKWIIDHMALYTEGIFGMPVGVSATYAFLFILFGSILSECGAAPFFFDLSISIFGKQKGGVGKVAVLSSGLMGTVTGSAPGNVFATGTMTIPMMKRNGFAPEVAGGIEAAASTGGQIMPPVMGSAAFLMAEFLGVPYSQIIKMAAIPAILYYISVYTSLHLYALKNNLQGEKEVPRLLTVLKKAYYLLPIAVLVGAIVYGFSTTLSCLLSIVGVALIPIFTKGPKEAVRILLRALSDGAKNTVSLAISCAVAGIFMGALSITGLGFKLTSVLIGLAGGIPWLVVLFVMVAVIIMGMGMPTPPAYAFAAALAAPTLIELGFIPAVAHLYVMYIACFSSITPPVALASYAAASIAETDFNKTGIAGFLMGAAGLLIPLQFLYEPQLVLLEVTSIWDLSRIIIGAIIGIVFLSSAIQGWLMKKMSAIERAFALAAALLLLDSGVLTDIIGMILGLLIVVVQYRKKTYASAK
jgi:TRAP transporter 4TM/12TM fusion protein